MSPGCVSLTDVAEGRPVLLRASLDDKLGAPPAWPGVGVGGTWLLSALCTAWLISKPQFCCCYVVIFFLKSHFLHC